MKQIVAIVKPYLVEKVLESLKRAPLEAVCVREVKGYGRQKSYLDEYVGSEYSQAFLPKVEIELWVDDARVEEVSRTIVSVARTGRMGDGKIFVLPAVLAAPTRETENAERPPKTRSASKAKPGEEARPNATKSSEPSRRSRK